MRYAIHNRQEVARRPEKIRGGEGKKAGDVRGSFWVEKIRNVLPDLSKVCGIRDTGSCGGKRPGFVE